jgi:peroxiredoxin Q/BCP
MLQVNDNAPLDVVLMDENGDKFTLCDLLGGWVVVYFYPKDDTPGCTIEAEGFRDMQEAFKKLGARVLGVSKDNCASHQKFIDKKKLTYTLVADEDHSLMEAFGTWGERSFMGRTYMGTSRSTFLIDPKGKVVHVWEKVKPIDHAKDVLEVINRVTS